MPLNDRTIIWLAWWQSHNWFRLHLINLRPLSKTKSKRERLSAGANQKPIEINHNSSSIWWLRGECLLVSQANIWHPIIYSEWRAFFYSYLRIWYISHRSMSQEYYDKCAVAQNANHENDGEYKWHDIGFWSLYVRRVAVEIVVQTFGVVMMHRWRRCIVRNNCG